MLCTFVTSGGQYHYFEGCHWLKDNECVEGKTCGGPVVSVGLGIAISFKLCERVAWQHDAFAFAYGEYGIASMCILCNESDFRNRQPTLNPWGIYTKNPTRTIAKKRKKVKEMTF